MVAFLEKHFEFTTALPMDVCVARLKAKSTRRSGIFASRREILVRISEDVNGKSFILDRDWGRNLYAEVRGQLRTQPDNVVYVTGFGRAGLFSFLFLLLSILAACFIVYYFRTVPALVFGFLIGIMNLMFWLLILSNRNNLIYVIEQTLKN